MTSDRDRTIANCLAHLHHPHSTALFRFGRVMQENLLARGCLLAGVAACRDKAAQSRAKVLQKAVHKAFSTLISPKNKKNQAIYPG